MDGCFPEGHQCRRGIHFVFRPPQNRTITVRKGDISAQNQEIICDVESPTDLAPRN